MIMDKHEREIRDAFSAVKVDAPGFEDKLDFNKITKTKKVVKLPKMVAAGLGLFLILGFSFPSYASQIPVIGNMFNLLNQGEMFANFGQDVNAVGIVDGKIVTIEQVVFEGNFVHMRHTIESDSAVTNEEWWRHVLGNPRFDLGWFRSVNFSGWGTIGSELERIDEERYLYRGMTTLILSDANRDLDGSILSFDMGGTRFSFPVERLESTEIFVETALDFDGYRVVVERIEISPFGLFLHYRQHWNRDGSYGGTIRFRVEDEFGNEFNLYTGTAGNKGDMWVGWSYFIPETAVEIRELHITGIKSNIEFYGLDENGNPRYHEVESIIHAPIVIQIP